ncbi:MAG: PD-(D/E)XK nuclease family protein, partial [Firmicutes bacterium]|nr:PD-(D/E)XK nuclease family protein [Bacillota bacterium]
EEQQQIWGIFCGLLDQCVELLGDDEMTLEEYASLLTDSFNDIKVGLLPQAQGRVLLGTLSRSLTGRCRALFLAGVNEGILPRQGSSEAILSQRELEELKEKGYTLAKTDAVLQEENDVTVYSAFTLPSEQLSVFWCVSDAEGKELKPSPLVRQLRAMFPDLPEEEDVENADEPLAFIQGRKAAAARLASAMREPLAEGAMPAPLWQEVYDQLEDTDAVKAGLLFTNKEKPLTPEEAKALFAYEEYSLSPSRLEGFAHCPFRHFVNYGLRPQDPDDFEISPLVLGTAHHACLQKIAEWLSQPAVSAGKAITDPSSRWMTVTEQELAEKMRQIAEDVQAEEGEGVMEAGPKEKYQAGRIAQVCTQFAWMMVLQVRKGRIEEMFFETEFKRGKPLPPVRIETPLGAVFLEGKIDRLDVLSGSDARYAKVIDYKSGKNRFDPKQAAEGLMLQLGIYLEAALGRGDVKPAGVFYYQIQEPETGSEAENLASDELAEDIWTKIRSSYKMNGYFVDSPDVIRAIDKEVGPGESSEVFNYTLKKDGTRASRSGGTTPEEFEAFRETFRRTLADLCTRLMQGDTDVAPRKLKKGVACTYCDFKGICAFDTAFEANRYH